MRRRELPVGSKWNAAHKRYINRREAQLIPIVTHHPRLTVSDSIFT